MEIIKSKKFESWYEKLDLTQKVQVDVRLTRIFLDNNFGNFKRIENIFELKFKTGLRVYFAKDGVNIIILLSGGNKNSLAKQSRDIQLAKKIFQEYRECKSGK